MNRYAIKPGEERNAIATASIASPSGDWGVCHEVSPRDSQSAKKSLSVINRQGLDSALPMLLGLTS